VVEAEEKAHTSINMGNKGSGYKRLGSDFYKGHEGRPLYIHIQTKNIQFNICKEKSLTPLNKSV
jgi:hypothetical protein